MSCLFAFIVRVSFIFIPFPSPDKERARVTGDFHNPGDNKGCQQPKDKPYGQADARARKKIADPNAQVKVPCDGSGDRNVEDDNCRTIIEKAFTFKQHLQTPRYTDGAKECNDGNRVCRCNNGPKYDRI